MLPALPDSKIYVLVLLPFKIIALVLFLKYETSIILTTVNVSFSSRNSLFSLNSLLKVSSLGDLLFTSRKQECLYQGGPRGWSIQTLPPLCLIKNTSSLHSGHLV